MVYSLAKMAWKCVWLLVACVAPLLGDECALFRDLMTVEQIDQSLCERMPITYNHLLQGGYFSMPSARMGDEGMFAVGYASVPPYRIWSLRFQLADRIEVTGNYRVFKGISDPILSEFGFGDKSDKGANVKIAILHPEDSDYALPGVAIGFEDFLGTRSFQSQYIVATQVIPRWNLEMSLGFGGDRINKWFGGACWLPFRKCDFPYLRNLKGIVEYDATRTSKDPHPEGRERRTHWNVGVNWSPVDPVELSAGYMRGLKWAMTASLQYNIGQTPGFLPKFNAPLPYTAPVNRCGTEETPFAHILKEHGFRLLRYTPCDDLLKLHVYNCCFRSVAEMRRHLNALIAALTPSHFSCIEVILEGEGYPIQKYLYDQKHLSQYLDGEMCDPELNLITPPHNLCCSEITHCHKRDLLRFLRFFPRLRTLFGSARGKFKYSLGVGMGVDGFLPGDLYYSLVLGYPIWNDLEDISDVDRLNPSQLINVRTDIIRYYKRQEVRLDEGYIQKSWNMGSGLFSRLSTGYFEVQYGGVASEILYYPVNCPLAVGAEASLLFKREFEGLGFTDRVRKLDGFTPSHRHFIGTQAHFNLYYDWRNASLDFKVAIGKFLANDYGARFEVSRYFDSGLILTLWTTYTNGRDKINGETYYDKGIAFSMPLDIFYTTCSRARWGNTLSAWLRDVGVIASTGKRLYPQIRELRE